MWHGRHRLLACVGSALLLAGLSACNHTEGGANGESIIPPGGVASPDYENADIIRPGDTIDLYVLEDERFNGRFPVRQGGHIVIPKVGRVKVGGLNSGKYEWTS